jgi:hypothetical protein
MLNELTEVVSGGAIVRKTNSADIPERMAERMRGSGGSSARQRSSSLRPHITSGLSFAITNLDSTASNA